MDIRDLQYKLQNLSEKLPGQGAADKAKLVVVVTVLPVLLIWLAYYLFTSLMPAPVAELPDTPAWRIAMDLNEKLSTEPEFHDVGFSVASDNPMKFKVEGAVYSDKDLPKLDAKLKELRPEGDYELHIEVLAR